jgi:hypothetical protein
VQRGLRHNHAGKEADSAQADSLATTSRIASRTTMRLISASARVVSLYKCEGLGLP